MLRREKQVLPLRSLRCAQVGMTVFAWNFLLETVGSKNKSTGE
jgi:hypothetical protein